VEREDGREIPLDRVIGTPLHREPDRTARGNPGDSDQAAPESRSAAIGAGSFFRDAGVLAAAYVLSQAIWLGSAPILTRLYSPDDFGLWALFTTIVSILTTIATLRYEFAIVLPRGERETSNVIVLCFVVSLLSTSLVVFVVSRFGHSIAALFAVDRALGLVSLAFVPTLVWLTGVQQIGRFAAVRDRRFRSVAVFLVLQAGLTAAMQIGSGLAMPSDARHLLTASVLANVIALGVLAVAVGPDLRRKLRQYVSVKQVAASALRYRNFPLYSAPYGLLGMATTRALFLLIALYASADTVGLFALAMRAAYFPSSLIGGALSHPFYQRASADRRDGSVEGLVRRLLVHEVMLITPAGVLFILNSEALFSFAFGAGWRVAGTYASLLGVPALLLLLTSWLDRLYDILERQRLALMLELTYDVIVISCVVGCFWFGLGPYWAIGAFSLITTLYNAIWLGLTLRIAGFSMSIYLDVILRAGALALLTLAVHVVLLRNLEPLGYALAGSAFVLLVSGGPLVTLAVALRPRGR